MTSIHYYKLGLVLLMVAGLWSCQEDDEAITPVPAVEEEPTVALTAEERLRDTTFQIMKTWYLWNQEMPTVDSSDYATADALIDALRNDLDKWSYITTEAEYDAYFSAGEYKGYGYGPAFDEDQNLRVSLVYQDSPFGRAGVERGWIINKINGESVSPNTYSNELIADETNAFEFITHEGETVTETLTKSTIAINTVLDHRVIDVDGQPVGYLAFNGFIENSLDELKPVFEEFQQASITDLVLDLRYNGGGRVNVAEYMASNLIGTRGTDRIFMKYAFNSIVQNSIEANPEEEANLTTRFETPEFPLDLDRLIVIGSGRTASASELLINGLKPFMDVLVVGENTHGKPVGSFPFRFEGYAISPISFRLTNDNGEGDYFGGFAPDALVADDISRPFGDPEEARLKEALYFIRTGAFSTGSARTVPVARPKAIEFEGFQQEIGTL